MTYSTTTDDICFATFGGFHELSPYIVKCLNVWSPVSNTVWVGFRKYGHPRRKSNQGLALKFQKPCIISSVFSMLPVGCSRRVLSALSATMPDACYHASLM